jgi:hypothetical protein
MTSKCDYKNGLWIEVLETTSGQVLKFVVWLQKLLYLQSACGAEFFRVHLKRENRPKRDIVDTSFHASCAFGHTPMLGLGFPHTMGVEPTRGVEGLKQTTNDL